MIGPRSGRLVAAALALCGLAAAPAAGAALLVVDAEAGTAAAVPLAPDGRWCLLWNHSAAGVAVADCFRREGNRMVLDTTRHPDVAAGLGESPGAVLAPDGLGGYLIEGLDRPVPETGLALRRAGPAVAQRISTGGREVPLPPGRVGARMVIRLAPGASISPNVAGAEPPL